MNQMAEPFPKMSFRISYSARDSRACLLALYELLGCLLIMLQYTGTYAILLGCTGKSRGILHNLYLLLTDFPKAGPDGTDSECIASSLMTG